MSKIEFVSRKDRKCLLCQRTDLYKDGRNELSKILEGNLIESCHTHFPEDLSKLVDWNTPLTDGPIFCCRCFYNVVKLSTLNEKLVHLQKEIEFLQRQMYMDVFSERERQNSIIWKKQPAENSKAVAEFPENPLLVICPEPETITSDFPASEILGNYEDEMETTEVFAPSEIQSEFVSADNSQTLTQNMRKGRTTKIFQPGQMATRSEKEAQFECGKCHKKFSRFRTLKRHDCKTKTSECPICGNSFTADYLEQHVLSVHEGRTRDGFYKCSYCGELFSSKQKWVDHIQKNHLESWPYVCDKCSARFLFLSQLKSHEKVHETRGKLSKCPACDHGQTTPEGFQKHFRQVHEKFKCGVCSTFCEGEANFKTHLRTHKIPTTPTNINYYSK